MLSFSKKCWNSKDFKNSASAVYLMKGLMNKKST